MEGAPMTGLGKNRLLSALLISALAFFLISVSSLFSADAGTPAGVKTEGKQPLTVGKDTLTAGGWYDEFKKNALTGKPGKDNKDLGGWAVKVSWLKEQIAEYERKAIREALLQEQGVEGADPAKYEYFIFVVTRDKKEGRHYKDEKIVDPAKHRLWIRGFRNPESFAEDFPPVQWP
jgi:hypothetical protein